jgi:hypothetical protein
MQKPFPTFKRIVPNPVDICTIISGGLRLEPNLKFDGMDGFSPLGGVSLHLRDEC